MTVSEKKMIDEMQKKLERLANELNELKKSSHDGFEKLETDHFLTQAYN
jgi:chaperonin cofactor prefoldin